MGWASHPDAISVKLRLDREAGRDRNRVGRAGVGVHVAAAVDIPEISRRGNVGRS